MSTENLLRWAKVIVKGARSGIRTAVWWEKNRLAYEAEKARRGRETDEAMKNLGANIDWELVEKAAKKTPLW